MTSIGVVHGYRKSTLDWCMEEYSKLWVCKIMVLYMEVGLVVDTIPEDSPHLLQ